MEPIITDVYITNEISMNEKTCGFQETGIVKMKLDNNENKFLLQALH